MITRQLAEANLADSSFGATEVAAESPLCQDVLSHLGPVAVLTALRDSDDSIVDFLIDYANPAFCSSVGYAEADVLGRRLVGLHPFVDPVEFDALCCVVETGGIHMTTLTGSAGSTPHDLARTRVVRFRDGCLMSSLDSAVVIEQAQQSVEVEVWCRSTGKWVEGFLLVGLEPDGTVRVRRRTDRNALPEPLPREFVRPATTQLNPTW